MSCTNETSQSDMSPLNEEARKNMKDMSVTPDRSGISVALYTMLDAPSNADFILVHWMAPH